MFYSQEMLYKIFIERNILFDELLAFFFLNFVSKLFDGSMYQIVILKFWIRVFFTSFSLVNF